MKGRYKLIVKDGDNEVFELYDIQNDPREERNLIDTYPEKVKQMHVELLEWQESVLHSLTGVDYVEDL
jgi:arylsulfatase A-like enzyme